AVDVDRVRQAEVRGGLGEGGDDLPRRHVEHLDGTVEAGDVAAALLPDLDAAGVDQLHAVALGGTQQPGGVGAQAVHVVRRDLAQDVVVVAEEDQETLVDDGRVVELLVGVAGSQGRDGGVERGGVAEAGVEVAGGEGAGHAAGGAGARQRRAADDRGLALVLRPPLARDVDLRPGDVGVHVYAARHDAQAGGSDDLVGADLGIGRRGDDLPVADPDVGHGAVDVVDGVVYGAVGNLEEGHDALKNLDLPLDDQDFLLAQLALEFFLQL